MFNPNIDTVSQIFPTKNQSGHGFFIETISIQIIMENNIEKTVQVNIENYTGEKPIEIVVRKGEAARQPEPLPTKAPEKIDVSGVLATPLEWLRKRVAIIDQTAAHILVEREKLTITLVVNERDYYSKAEIEGVIDFSEKFLALGINNKEKSWEPAKLGQFLRLNRAVFEDKDESAKLLSVLKGFQAQCNAVIQKQTDPSGSRSSVYQQQVESNLPKSFTVNLPIFKGTAKQAIEVEFDHYVSDGDVRLQLVSPGANEFTESYRDTEIDNVLAQIREVAPDIAILEL